MEITGTVLEIHEIQTGQGKKEPWHKQECIIEIPGKYPKKVAILYWGAMVDSLTEIGQEVTVNVNPESREYNGRWYTELRVWKTLKLGQSANLPPQGSRISQEAEGNRAYEMPKSNPASQDDGSDLPF